MNNHRLYIGSSGRGKDVGAMYDILQEVVGRSFLHYTDIRGDNAKKFSELLYGRWDNTLFDGFTRRDYVLPLSLSGAA